MKQTLSEAVERARIEGPRNGGPFGVFRLRAPLTDARLLVVVSDARDWAGSGLPGAPWEHVSVSLPNRCPTWEEMCFVKDAFWEAWEWVVQYHPAEAEHIDFFSTALHLWRPVGVDLPKPPAACV